LHIFPTPTLAIHGSQERFPVRRLYCVGRNYADHAREMGQPHVGQDLFFFTKWADVVCDSGSAVPYPPGTANYQYEVELVVAIGSRVNNVTPSQALECVFGYACGLDMTRRDQQLAAREKSRPWDVGKNFDASAPIGAIHRAAEVGNMKRRRLWLEVNGVLRQDTNVDQMLFPVDTIIAHLSSLYVLEPGDVIMTGTPAGVGAVARGDKLVGHVEGLSPIAIDII